MNEKRLLVAMGCDRRYLYPWAVAFVSLYRNSRSAFRFWFGLAQDWRLGLSSGEVDQVLALAQSLGVDAQAIEVSIETAGLQKDSYISSTAFVKLGLLDLCPSDTQMVWFDADLVARAAWNGVLDVSGGYSISGNHEANPAFEDRWLGQVRNRYVNTGVLVIDGELWRANYAGKWQQYLATYAEQGFRYLDQDVLNATVLADWNLFESEYNFRPIHNRDWIDAAIVHFSGRYKPWLRTRVQTKLLKDAWSPAYRAYANAETDFMDLLYSLPAHQQEFWIQQRNRTRGFLGLRAWRNYLEVTLQGLLKLN